MVHIKDCERTEFPLDKEKLSELMKGKKYSSSTLSLILTTGKSNSIIGNWYKTDYAVYPLNEYGQKLCEILNCKYSDLFHSSFDNSDSTIDQDNSTNTDVIRLLTMISNKLDEVDAIKSLLIALNNNLVWLREKLE